MSLNTATVRPPKFVLKQVETPQVGLKHVLQMGFPFNFELCVSNARPRAGLKAKASRGPHACMECSILPLSLWSTVLEAAASAWPMIWPPNSPRLVREVTELEGKTGGFLVTLEGKTGS